MLLANIVVFNLFTSSVDNENLRLRLALAIPTGIPITVANDAIEMLPLVADKTIKKRIKIIKRSNVLTKSFAH